MTNPTAQPHPPQYPELEKLRFAHLAPLAGFAAIVLMAAVALTTLLEPISEYPGYLTQHENALTITAVMLAALLAIAMPLWGQRPQQRDLQRRFYWYSLRMRLAEAGVVLATGVPFLLVAAIFSGDPLWRVAEIQIGLLGTAVLAVAWRIALVGAYRLLRQAAVLDLLLTTLGPIILGYLLLEGRAVGIGWLWRLSPLAIAADLAGNGFVINSAAFWIGTIVFTIAGLLLILLLHRLMPPNNNLVPPAELQPAI